MGMWGHTVKGHCHEMHKRVDAEPGTEHGCKMGRGSRRNAEEVVRAMAPAPLRRRPSRPAAASRSARRRPSIPRWFDAAAGGAATVGTAAAAVSPKAGGVTGAAAVSLKAGFVVAVD